MGKQPFISHVVNGYSRYDVPNSVAFSCTAGIAYPVRVDYINARDRVTIAQGIDVRSNPLAVPTFNPYTVRLHRFWVPLQLYHPEMRTNSSNFDMNNLSLNWIPFGRKSSLEPEYLSDTLGPYQNSLFAWLGLGSKIFPEEDTSYGAVSLPQNSSTSGLKWVNADTYLAYWDIVRNYYSFSQWKLFSFAWPGSWSVSLGTGGTSYETHYSGAGSLFTQRYGNLEFLDAYFESQFYPSSVSSSNGTYNRGNLFFQLMHSDISVPTGVNGSGYPVSQSNLTASFPFKPPVSQFGSTFGSSDASFLGLFSGAHPMAVVPSSPDRFSRLLPTGRTENAVGMGGVTNIPQLAVASRLQEYKDLLGAGGSRYSDWLETFFASRIDHVDRPKLLFSASQTVNVQVVMNQAGSNMFDSNSQPLGQQGGAIAFNSPLGRSQSYFFKEPGYMIDILSIRPVYYWTGVLPDYLKYEGSDYFNPLYNDIGYQDLSGHTLGSVGGPQSVAQEPCFNEFRSSYDVVKGSLAVGPGISGPTVTGKPLYSYWVQQRYYGISNEEAHDVYPFLFVDMSTVNSPFASEVEDNFFVNLSYSIRKKNLVNKTFATRLTNR